MVLFTPRLRVLGLLAGLGLAHCATAQQSPRYIFPNIAQGRVQALPNGQILLVTGNRRVLQLHWLNAQGDTVRGQRLVLPGVTGVSVRGVALNAYTGTTLISCAARSVLLSAQGDTLWTRPLNLPAELIGTPDGGFAALDQTSDPVYNAQLPTWIKISANGQKTGETQVPLPATVDWSYPISIVPAATGGCWLVVGEVNLTGYITCRLIQISDTGVVGAQQSLTLGTRTPISRVAALPNPADGYLINSGSQVQRFSAAWVPQWPAPVTGYDGLSVAPDGNALLFMAGPYVRLPDDPADLTVGVGQVTPQGQRLYASVVDVQSNCEGVGYDIAKNTTGSLIVHTVSRRLVGSTTPSLLVYALPSAALTTRSKAVAPALAVYPQPATEAVTIRTTGLRGPLTLLDGLGRVVRQLPVEAGQAEQQLPLRGLAAGIYVLRATDASGQQLSTRLSKQ